MARSPLQIMPWTEVGYKPLVFHADWQVALLNWEPIFDLENVAEVERHNDTDEVFVLVKGKAVMFTADNTGFYVEEMQPGTVYNVPQGVWHNLVSTRDATWVIVENRDTHLHDTELRQMTTNELAQLVRTLPDWAKGS